MKRRILALVPYPLRSAPSQRFRFEQYISLFANADIDFEVRPLLRPEESKILYQPGFFLQKANMVLRGALSRLRDLLSARRYDLVFIHREAFPLGAPLLETVLPLLGIPYVFDFDDAIYLSNASAANRLLAPLKFAQKTAWIARNASLVIAGNPFLAEWASQYNKQVRVIPTTIDTAQYAYQAPQTRTPLCLGWSGSVTTIAHLAPLSGVLRRLQEKYKLRLRVIGDPRFAIEGAEVEALPWREETELADLGALDIGIMPLPDEPWARGKCGLKALQYMALGVPTVMSPVGVNREIASGGAAMLAQTEDEWFSTLSTLIENNNVRLALGSAGRARVEAEYSVAAVFPLYLAAFEDVLRGRP